LAAVGDDFAGAGFEPVVEAFAVAAELVATAIEDVGGDGAEILTGGGDGCLFGGLGPGREVILPGVAGVDGAGRVGEGKPAFAAGNELREEVEG